MRLPPLELPFPIDAFHLARAEFAFTVAFHIIFPAFSIGLASYLAVLEGLHLWTRKQVYMDAGPGCSLSPC